MKEKLFNIIKCWIKSFKFNVTDSPPQKDGDIILFGEIDCFSVDNFGFLILLSQAKGISLPNVSNIFIGLKRYSLFEI